MDKKEKDLFWYKGHQAGLEVALDYIEEFDESTFLRYIKRDIELAKGKVKENSGVKKRHLSTFPKRKSDIIIVKRKAHNQ